MSYNVLNVLIQNFNSSKPCVNLTIDQVTQCLITIDPLIKILQHRPTFLDEIKNIFMAKLNLCLTF